jgi:hypothetical protein
MKPGERGQYGTGGWPRQRGPMSQRELLPILRTLTDAAMGRVSSAHRDKARQMLHRVLAESHWQTSFIYHNLNPTRCRFLQSQGYDIPYEFHSVPITEKKRAQMKRRKAGFR